MARTIPYRCEDGSLYLLSDGKNVQDRKYSHLTGKIKTKTGKEKEPPVTAIYHDDTRGILLTGSKEGSVVIWSSQKLNTEPVGAIG